MAKSKKKRRKSGGGSAKGETRVNWGGVKRRRMSAREWGLGLAVVLAVAGYFGWSFWQSRESEASFLALAEDGAPRLEAAVSQQPNFGRRHLAPGENHQYGDPYPTSGAHSTVWTKPGFYGSPQGPIHIVHALEHGNIVIYYDEPGAEVMARIRAWVDLYSGQWEGLIAVPKAGQGKKVVLSAWRRRLEMADFDPALAAAFIDAYRGRGPEHPVR